MQVPVCNSLKMFTHKLCVFPKAPIFLLGRTNPCVLILTLVPFKTLLYCCKSTLVEIAFFIRFKTFFFLFPCIEEIERRDHREKHGGNLR